jgi:putative SOS response-associated peptidase YedK
MCGRNTVACDSETLVSGFSLVRVHPFAKRWNVALQSALPVVHENREGERVAGPMQARPVSKAVNRGSAEGEPLITPLPRPPPRPEPSTCVNPSA